MTDTTAPANDRTAGLRILVIFATTAGVIGILAYGFTKDPRNIPSPVVGRQAPDFELRLLDGSMVRLSDYQGRVVFLNCCASWCPPCRAEALLQKLVEASQGVVTTEGRGAGYQSVR